MNELQEQIGTYLVGCAREYAQERAEGKLDEFELLPKRYEYRADKGERSAGGEPLYRVSYPSREPAGVVA